MAVFDGVHYSFSPSLPPTRRNELAAVLDLNGAVPEPPYTHLIVLQASHAHTDAASDPTVKIVADRWVDRSVVLGKCQPEQYYSPDPAMIFAGVVACATDLSVADLEVLSAGITALGGQWRIGLTRDVTHLFALRTGSDKYNTALHFAPQTHMCIVTPHWFDDSVRLGRRVPEKPYTWPDPLVLRPGITLDLDEDALTMEGRRKQKTHGDTEAGGGTDALNEGEHARVWADRRILLSTSLELSSRSRGAIEAGIRRAGGVIVRIAENASEDVEEKAVDGCDVFVTRWRSGKPYFKAASASLLIGTLTWLFSVESSGTLHSPLDSLLWYPTPRGGIPGLVNCEISVTNYTGAARDYLKRLIVLIGAKFTPNMSQSNKVLVAGFQPSPKTTRALAWSIPVVNHTWLEDCFIEWRSLTVGLERYIMYPPGIDFGKMLMTGRDEPPTSQPEPILRVSGGAVPGGRGVGIIDLEKEKTRDTEYHARVYEDKTPTSPLEGNARTDRPKTRSRAGSVKKTPSSSSKAKLGSMSTPLTVSGTGAFVDHVIELPTDEDDVEVRRTPENSRSQPLSATRRVSSADLFSTRGNVQVVVPRLESGRKGRDKEKGERKGDIGKRPQRSAEEEEEEDFFQSSCSAKSKAGLSQQRLGAPNAPTTDERVLAQASKQTQQTVERKVVDSDLESRSEGSVPPRRTIGARLATPIKSGMKPRPRSKSLSRPRSVPVGESEDEVRMLAAESGTAAETGKGREEVAEPTRNGEVASKEKERGEASRGRKATAQSTSRAQSRTRTLSPPLPASESKIARPPKRRLSVVIPPAPKDYFSSQQSVRAKEAHDKDDHEHERDETGAGAGAGATSKFVSRGRPLAAAASIHVDSTKAPMSTSKRAKTHPAKASGSSAPRTSAPQPKSKSKSKTKPKPGTPKRVARAHASEDEEEMDDGHRSMVAETSVTSTSRGGPRRGAANEASTRLREKIMPDVVSFEKERRRAKRKRSTDWESIVSVREEAKEERKREKGGKRRRVSREEEEVEEAEVEVVVMVPPVKARARAGDGKGKEKSKAAAESDEESEDLWAKSKSDASHNKKSGGWREKGSAVVRLMTTGVTLSDDVVKRLTKLGVQMTTKPMDCTHLVAKGIVRTEKFLCAMSVSPHILNEGWANASAKNGKLLSESDYQLSDAVAEEKWAFTFADALARAKEPDGGSSLFKQMTFYITPKVSVDAKLLKNVVSAGGGQVQTSTMPTVRILRGKANRYVISCEEDKGIWRSLVAEGFKVYSAELLLRAALRQEIEWERQECLVAG